MGFLEWWTATVSGSVSMAAGGFTIRHQPATTPLKLAHYPFTGSDVSGA